MAYSNVRQATTVTAGEDLSNAQYHAVALDDGKLAVNGEEASGILINKPKAGEPATIAWQGESQYRAGAAVTKGAKLTVATSGWFTTGDSGSYIVGEAKTTITSGSIGTGLFSFPTAPYLSV